MATSVLQELACQTIDKREPELYQISQDIWNNPELELEEQHAHDVLTSLLKKEGFDVEENFILPTGFRAVFGTDVGPNICVICEYDALPEIGHGSGRNLVTECTIASALGLKEVIRTSMAARKSVGKVTVLGCPASESGGAKVDMLTAGVFQNIDVVMKSQPQHHNIAKAVLLDMLQMKVTYSGKPTHASLPWEGRNALDAAVLCYNNIAALRQQTKTSMQIHGIISKGGVMPSMIPEETEMEFYLRAADARDLHILQQKVAACIIAAGKATGCEAHFEFSGKPFRNMLHNDVMVELFQKHAEMLGAIFPSDPEVLVTPTGSSDMGNVSYVVPSIRPTFSIDTPAIVKTAAYNQAVGTKTAHKCTLIVAKAMAMAAVEVLEEPELFEKIKKNFEIGSIPHSPSDSLRTRLSSFGFTNGDAMEN